MSKTKVCASQWQCTPKKTLTSSCWATCVSMTRCTRTSRPKTRCVSSVSIPVLVYWYCQTPPSAILGTAPVPVRCPWHLLSCRLCVVNWLIACMCTRIVCLSVCSSIKEHLKLHFEASGPHVAEAKGRVLECAANYIARWKLGPRSHEPPKARLVTKWEFGREKDGEKEGSSSIVQSKEAAVYVWFLQSASGTNRLGPM